MAEYINKQQILDKCKSLAGGAFSTPLIIEAIEKAEEEDVVPIEAYKQIKWELDIAIEQLQSYGVGFAEKKELIEVKRSRWETISGFDVCNICGTSPAYCEPKPNNPKGYPPYCHQCGAKMDGGNTE